MNDQHPALPSRRRCDRTTWMEARRHCSHGRRRTPAKETRSPRRGGGCRWWRSTPHRGDRPRRTDDDPRRFEGRKQLIAYFHMWWPAGLLRASARAARSSTAKSASCPTSTRATPPTPRSARARTRRASATATSSAWTCRGTRSRNSAGASWRDALAAASPRLLPPRRRASVRDVLDRWSRRRGHGAHPRAAGHDRLRPPGDMGGLAGGLAAALG